MSLGLYVHLPFCRVHCTYCPFVISTDESQQETYVEALLQEIDRRSVVLSGAPVSSPAVRRADEAAAARRRRVAGEDTGAPRRTQHVESIYLGGGTPSRTGSANLRRIVTRIRERFDVAPDAELSMESNPEDITAEALRAWRDLGVNRLSIGVQSFHDSELQPLHRVHTAERAREAIALAVRTMPRVSLDLILGLPGQTQESFEATLAQAIASGVGHISLYMLDLEERTPLQVQVERGRISIPDDELVASLYVRAIETLERAGFHQYEISNFAREGEECRHNLRYWTGGAYHGLGVGAHSFGEGRRFANTRNIHTYIEWHGDAADFSEIIGEAESRRERLFLLLRQTSGIHYDELQRLCGQEGIEWLDRGLRDGWLRREGERVAFTPSGFLLSTELISQLF